MRIVKTTLLLLVSGLISLTSCTKEDEETLPLACTEKIENLENFVRSRQIEQGHVINASGPIFIGKFVIDGNLLKLQQEGATGYQVVFDLCEMSGYKELSGSSIAIYF